MSHPPNTRPEPNVPAARPVPSGDEAPARTPEQESAIRAAGVWVHQFARTLKTCRLYDGENPTVLRFRSEIASSLYRTLEEHGALKLKFTSEDVLCDEVSLYPARSRDDNLALPFYRDGVRFITFQPGVQPREVETLVDAVLHVTGQNVVEDDLVTMLWEAELPHVEVDYIPGEGDMGASTAQSPTDEEGPLLPWPTGSTVTPETEGATVTPVSEEEQARIGEAKKRSDDWQADDQTVEIEAGFIELDSLAPGEVQRFQHEILAERAIPLLTASVAIAEATLSAESNPDDRHEVARFLPRLLRQAVSQGVWLEARESIRLLQLCDAAEWTIEGFVQELLQPISISGLVEKLDAQEEAQVLEFITFAQHLGDGAVDCLSLVLAESQVRKYRRVLAEAIAGLCRDNPERLASYLSDPRWYVVRNVVHILSWIGGPHIVGLLQTAMRHPDARVKQEVIAALGTVETRLARPMLLRMMDGGDTRRFCAVLHQLSATRDSGVARLLLGYMQDPAFEARAPEERQAIYSAIAATAGEESIPELESELHKGNWFSRNADAHRLSVARALARIGTPQARLVLERAVQSRRAPVRRASEEALMGITHER